VRRARRCASAAALENMVTCAGWGVTMRTAASIYFLATALIATVSVRAPT
jgi:hypothetical protein